MDQHVTLAASAPHRRPWRAALGRFGSAGIFGALLVLCVLLSLVTPRFLNTYNLMTVLRQASFVGIIAFGETLVLLTGGIDLSVGAAAGFSAIVGSICLVNLGLDPYLVIPVTCCFGLLVGLINGFLIAYVGLNSFIVTLASWQVLAGATLVVTEGNPVGPLGETFQRFGRSEMFGVSGPVIAFLTLAAIFSFVLARMPFGRNIYAVGGNRSAASLVGIAVKRVELLVFGLSGCLAALAGILYASRMNSADPSVGVGWLMPAITASIIGGVSLRGGQGTIAGTVGGALLMAVLDNGIVLANISSYWQQVIIGCVVLLAILVDLLRQRQ